MSTSSASPHSPAPCRRVCSWCGFILGLVTFPSQYHSYSICTVCIQRYFAPLYDPMPTNAIAQPLHERSIGES